VPVSTFALPSWSHRLGARGARGCMCAAGRWGVGARAVGCGACVGRVRLPHAALHLLT